MGFTIIIGFAGVGRAADTPAAGPLRIILTNVGTGCMAGAVQLPESGAGFQTIRAGKTAFWGAPQTIQAVQTLAERTRQAGLPDLYIGEFSRRRGGPIAGGHVSHQAGLDADIYFDLTVKPALSLPQRENLMPAGLVRAVTTNARASCPIGGATRSRSSVASSAVGRSLAGSDRAVRAPA